jgi:pimeloyl-ACP methyl ester carboxylesterase
VATFVLIHGGWSWDSIVPLLEKRGHTVLAPDLPGMGDDKTPLQEVSLESWASFVAELIRRQSEPVILVGRSRGGIVISRTAEYIPERIRALVYVAPCSCRMDRPWAPYPTGCPGIPPFSYCPRMVSH